MFLIPFTHYYVLFGYILIIADSKRMLLERYRISEL